jgi:centromeric protein E
MTIPQPRRAKSSVALRDQSLAQQRNLKVPPPLPSISSSSSSTPSISSGSSLRSVSSVSSAPLTPPPIFVPPATSPLLGKSPNSLLSEKLNFVTSELESYVEEEEEDDNQNNVHVAVRVKPNFNKDKDVWNADPLRGYVGGKLGDFFFGMQILVSELTVDYVYTGEDTNYSVYEASVKKLVRKTVEGYNGTVFAYGQTSSGKTHTMRGHIDEAGIIPLAIAELFEEISSVIFLWE